MHSRLCGDTDIGTFLASLRKQLDQGLISDQEYAENVRIDLAVAWLKKQLRQGMPIDAFVTGVTMVRDALAAAPVYTEARAGQLLASIDRKFRSGELSEAAYASERATITAATMSNAETQQLRESVMAEIQRLIPKVLANETDLVTYEQMMAYVALRFNCRFIWHQGGRDGVRLAWKEYIIRNPLWLKFDSDVKQHFDGLVRARSPEEIDEARELGRRLLINFLQGSTAVPQLDKMMVGAATGLGSTLVGELSRDVLEGLRSGAAVDTVDASPADDAVTAVDCVQSDDDVVDTVDASPPDDAVTAVDCVQSDDVVVDTVDASPPDDAVTAVEVIDPDNSCADNDRPLVSCGQSDDVVELAKTVKCTADILVSLLSTACDGDGRLADVRALREANAALAAEIDNLTRDNNELRDLVSMIEAENKGLRAKVEKYGQVQQVLKSILEV